MKPDPRLEERRIMRVEQEGAKVMPDMVVREVPLTIYLNGQEFVTLLCTPELLDMLAVGFLRSEGLIGTYRDIISLRVDRERGFVFVETEGGRLAEKLYGKRTITSGCGKGTVFFSVLDSLQSNPVESSLKVSRDEILGLMRDLQEKARLFKLTGGLHSAALGKRDSVLYFCEDIGRHNAVDKIAGLCLRDGVELVDKILVTSGRISSEILVKSAKLGIPVLVSRSAPTSLSIDLAEKLGLTLVGFARGRRFNIYSRLDRILLWEEEQQ